MARAMIFNTHPESSIDQVREDWLAKKTVPFLMRHELFEKERSINKDFKVEWRNYGFSDEFAYKYREFKKPAISHIIDLIERIEDAIPWQEWKHLSWEFSFHVIWYETEEAFRATTAVWFVTIRDRDGDIVHKNWKVWIETWETDLGIQRHTEKEKRHIFWERPEGRLKDAILSHIRLKHLKEQKN